MHSSNVTFEFASALHEWMADSSEVEETCRLLLIDGLAVAAAGAHEQAPSIVADLTRAVGAAAVATVIGHQFSTSPALAARVNGVSMHVLDFEPMWIPPNHAISPILPSLLALAERLEREGQPPQGQALLRGLAKGIEAQGRLRLASNQFEPNLAKLHFPGMVGPIAAAAACGELYRFDVDRTATAMAIAASCCAGVQANIGSMTKALHCGNSAMLGLECADLANRGFTADRDAIGSPRGYGIAYFGTEFDQSHLVSPVKIPRLFQPGIAWKLFPSNYCTHFAISAALDCRKEILDPSQIETILVTTPVIDYVDRPYPISGLEGKFSIQYCVAAALLDDKIDLDSFSDQRRVASDMEAMLRRVSLRQDKNISGLIDQMHIDVAVGLVDGRVIERHCDAPEGSWTRRVNPERVRAKARSLLTESLVPNMVSSFWERIDADSRMLRISDVMETIQLTK